MKDPNSQITDTTRTDATIQAVVRLLDHQAAQYSVATQIQLNEARARAIAATRKKTPFWRRTPILASAFAMSAALAFVILTQPQGTNTAADLEAIALYEATFGANVADDAAANTNALFDASAEQNAPNDAVVDESILANDLEFYAWLSEGTNADRVRSGSGS